MSLFLVLCHLAGYSPANDIDDLLKQVEIRNFLNTGAWFDRTIPGILQPEPFVSHWVRLVDLPYAAVAVALAPFAGKGAALAAAFYVVPLLLLLPVLAALRRIVAALEFQHAVVLFWLSLFFVMPSLFEFVPDRIDYHNLELALLLPAVAFSLDPRPPAAVVGALSAATLAISVEFAPFFALIMAIFAGSYVLGDARAAKRLMLFGTGLGATALLLYGLVTAPSRYGSVACDSYSTPHLTLLVWAALSFVIAGAASARLGGRATRFLLLGALAAAGIIAVALLFPECRAGPYWEVSDYVKRSWLFGIDQEKSILQRPDLVLSSGMLVYALLFIGALAPAALALGDRLWHRRLALFALFGLLALAMTLLYWRYFRYLALFAGPGILLTLAACLPRLRQRGAIFAGNIEDSVLSPVSALAPGILLVAALFCFHMVHTAQARVFASGASFAGDCNLTGGAPLEWPLGASILAPPNLAIGILAAEPTPRATIVATPHHPAWRGIERVYRFLDPRTPQPRIYLDQSKATHVAICAWRGPQLAKLEKSFPLTGALMEGRPPAWLSECPLPAGSPIRVYRYPAAGGASLECPTEAAGKTD